MRTTALTIALALATAANAFAAPMTIADKDLAATLEAHVKAVQSRDLPALEKTITTGEALDLILPNGKRLTTRAEFVGLHRDWFNETNWTWTLEPLAITMAGDMAIITAHTHYEEREGAKTTQTENYLSLAFRKEGGTWRLVHDQNTRIATKH
ncbi:MAG: nuclear transport factor 2 family protein [Alphaproteobacteria bacterium]|nr:nuclear transport factor 2 family protein [Alphaproteobacteria bacterium]